MKHRLLPLLATSVLAVALASAHASSLPLIDAVRDGNHATAFELIGGKTDVNAADNNGTTALHWAVHNNDLPLVERLLKARARAEVRNDFGVTPLLEAALIGNEALIERLLKAGANIETTDADGQTALMLVARTGNLAAARMLIKRGADVNAAEKWRGQTALMWAAAQNQPEMVRELLRHGAKPDARSVVNDWKRQVTAEPRAQYRPSGGWTALLYATRQGCLPCVQALVNAGANPDLANPDNVSPLLMATLNFNFDTAAWLLSKGANPDKWDWWGRSPLYAAVDLNTIPQGGRADRPSPDNTTSIELIRLLLDARANPNLQLKLLPPFRAVGADRGADLMLSIGATPLLRAAKAGDAAAVQLLLEHGALPNLPNETGITPLMAACGLGSTNIDTRGRYIADGENPIIQKEAIETLKALLAAGADINGRDDRGQTPLHGAAFWGWNDVVKFLVAHDAQLDARDKKGMTPVDSAMGRAGGNGRGGATIIIRKETAALLQELMATRAAKPAVANR